MKILGISLGTTTSGIAVISGGQLICWRIHSFRDAWSDEKVVLITSRYERYIRQYRPLIVVVKVPPKHHHTVAIKQLLKKLAALFQYHGCMAEYTTKEAVKADTPQVKNHSQLMEHAIELYPILLPEYKSALAGRNRYHAKLFDAVMAAHQGKRILAATPAGKGDG